MQGTSPNRPGSQETPPEPSSTVILVAMADTTWRMFVPSLVFAGLGLWLDSKWQTSPWLLIAGSIIGLIIAAFAVRSQLKKFM